MTPLREGTVKIKVKWTAGTSSTCNGSGEPELVVTVGSSIALPSNVIYEKVVVEPVSMADGAYLDTYVDMVLRGPLPIYFERHYSSTLGNDSRVMSALGLNWMHNYDITLTSDGITAQVNYQLGQGIRFSNATGAWLQTSADPLSYQLQQSGGTYRMLDPYTQLVYTFDGATGLLQSIRDRNDNAHTLTYGNGRLARVSDGLGASLDFTYSANTLTRVTDHSGRSVAFGYTQGQLTSFTDVAGQATTYTYAPFGPFLTALRLPRANSPVTNTYDSGGRVVRQADAASNAFTFAYDTTTGVSRMTDPLSQVSTFTHANRKLVREVDPANAVSTMAYDEFNRQLTRTDGAGRSTSYAYAADGLVKTVVTPDGATSFAYRSTTVDGFVYNDLVAVTYPDATTEQFEYDALGNVAARVDRTGQRWTLTYNSHGQPLTIASPTGGTVTFTYTVDGRSALASAQYPDMAPVQVELDALNAWWRSAVRMAPPTRTRTTHTTTSSPPPTKWVRSGAARTTSMATSRR